MAGPQNVVKIKSEHMSRSQRTEQGLCCPRDTYICMFTAGLTGPEIKATGVSTDG